MRKIDNVDRGFAAGFTLIAIWFIAIAFFGLISAFMAFPLWTVVAVVAVGWLFLKIYPRIIKAMENDSF